MLRKDTFSWVPGEMLVQGLVCIARETPPGCWEGTLLSFQETPGRLSSEVHGETGHCHLK